MTIPADMTVERAMALATEAEEERSKWMREAQRYKAGLEAVLGQLPAAVRLEVPADRKPEETGEALRRLLDRAELLRRAAIPVCDQYDEVDPTCLEPARVAALSKAARDMPVRNW